MTDIWQFCENLGTPIRQEYRGFNRLDESSPPPPCISGSGSSTNVESILPFSQDEGRVHVVGDDGVHEAVEVDDGDGGALWRDVPEPGEGGSRVWGDAGRGEVRAERVWP